MWRHVDVKSGQWTARERWDLHSYSGSQNVTESLDAEERRDRVQSAETSNCPVYLQDRLTLSRMNLSSMSRIIWSQLRLLWLALSAADSGSTWGALATSSTEQALSTEPTRDMRSWTRSVSCSACTISRTYTQQTITKAFQQHFLPIHKSAVTKFEYLYSPSKHGRQKTISNTNEIKQL